MSLATGARLGPYEIVSPLGAGGMGEVYRAKDGRLNRTVAIKILSEESAADADRRERFEREAKAISALDHPNICALYDVGEHDGTYFLVMPCLEGQPLADRIAKGPLPPDQAIKYAIEIATALDAAHRHGIIHRDLKPANIMLTKTGVKLLDFGLAKLKKATGPLGDTTMVKGTGIGTLLGTMPYMAPEQIEGHDVDARSDIFSLGAVIYEMVTGQRAFKGDSPGSVIGAILKDEPAPITTLQPLAPASLEHVVTTCLAKDPEERWQSAADIARELKWTSRPEAGVAPDRRSAGRSRWQWPAAIAAIGIASVAAVSWLARDAGDRPTDHAVQFRLEPTPGTVFTRTASSVPVPQIAVSPNGRQLAFTASEPGKTALIWVRPLNDSAAKSLAGTETAADLFWSPDSTQIGFFADGRLKRVEIDSGRVFDIATTTLNSRGGSWAPDGTIIFGDSADGIRRVAVASGAISQVTSLDGANSHRWPWFLPDGRHFLYYVRASADQRGIYVASLDGGPSTRLVATSFGAVYASGHVLTVRDGTLLAYPFDPRTLAIDSTSVVLASQVGGGSTNQIPVSASSNGVLAYGGGFRETDDLQWFDRAGQAIGTPLISGNLGTFRISPDESQVAATLIDPMSNTSDIWMVDLRRGTSSRKTLDPLNDLNPLWSADGKRFIFRSDREGDNFVFERNAKPGMPDELLAAGVISNPTDWSGDGQLILFHSPFDPVGGQTIYTLRLADKRVTPLVQTRYNEFDARFSPDGRWFAYVSEESGTPQVYVESFPRSDLKLVVSVNGGCEPRWRSDGRELFYLGLDQTVMSVDVDGRNTFQAGAAKPLFRTHIATIASPFRNSLEVSGDGRRFLINRAVDIGQQTQVHVAVNWLAAIR